MNRRQLLGEIKPSMKLTTGFFLKVYGYDLTWPGFADNVLARMEILGCSKAGDYYTAVVAEYEHNHEKELKAAAKWYKKRCEEDYERKAVRIAWIQREVEQRKAPVYPTP